MIKNIEKKIEFFMTEAKRRDFIVTRKPWAIQVEKRDSFIFCMIPCDVIDGCKTYTQLRYLLNDTEHEIAMVYTHLRNRLVDAENGIGMVFLKDKGVYKSRCDNEK